MDLYVLPVLLTPNGSVAVFSEAVSVTQFDASSTALVFGIRIPLSSSIRESFGVLVQGHLNLDDHVRPKIIGESFETSAWRAGAWGSFSIIWEPMTKSVHCWFSAGDDALEDFEFQGSVTLEEVAVLESSHETPLAKVRCLLAGAADFEPFLPPAEILAAHPHMTDALL